MSNELKSQVLIVDTICNQDCEILPFNNYYTIQGLKVSASVSLNSDSSLVRIIYIDDNNFEWLLLESLSIFEDSLNINYSKY